MALRRRQLPRVEMTPPPPSLSDAPFPGDGPTDFPSTMSQPIIADEEGMLHICGGMILRLVVPISRTEDGRSDTVDGKYSRAILRKLELVENRASYLELASFGGAVGCLLPSCTCVSIDVFFFGSPPLTPDFSVALV